jgi:autotransporter-associated beta strand protein
VIVTGGSKIKAIGANSYTGWTRIDSGSTFQPAEGNTGGLTSSAVTNNGTLVLIRQDNGVFIYGGPIVGSGKLIVDANNVNSGDVTLTGGCTYTGGTFIGDNGLIVGDGATSGSITGNVIFTNSTQGPNDNTRSLTFYRGDDITFSGNIVTNFSSAQNNRGRVQQNGSGVLTLTGNNTYDSGTVISAGTLQVGNGGTSGSIGTGGVTDNGTLAWNRSDNTTYSGAITGTGYFVKLGAGTLTLANTNLSYSGFTTLSNGTLIVSGQFAPSTVGIGGNDLIIGGGTLIPGGANTVVTNVVAGSLIMNAGTIQFTLNKSLAASNTVMWVTNLALAYSGNITIAGGTLKLVNAGPALTVGDKFTLFILDGNNPSQVTGMNNLTFVTPGFTINTSNLAVDGSVTVTAVSPAPTITTTVSGGNLNLSWPANWIGGVHLQNQTNSLAKGLGTNWVTIPGTDASNTYQAPINTTNGSVFYRLIAP